MDVTSPSFRKTSVLFNGFTVLVLISMLPTVLVLACLPLFAKELEVGVIALGVLFLLARLGGIIGAQVGPVVLSRVSVELASICCEFFSVVLSISLYFALIKKIPEVFFVLLPSKGMCTGFLSNTRVHWLKCLFPGKTGQRIPVVTNTIIQSSYGTPQRPLPYAPSELGSF